MADKPGCSRAVTPSTTVVPVAAPPTSGGWCGRFLLGGSRKGNDRLPPTEPVWSSGRGCGMRGATYRVGPGSGQVAVGVPRQEEDEPTGQYAEDVHGRAKAAEGETQGQVQQE